MKDPVEIQPPCSDRLFIIFRMETSRDEISFTPLADVPQDLVHDPAIEDFGEQANRTAYTSLVQLTSSVSQSLQGRTD